jgi:protein SCO1/2
MILTPEGKLARYFYGIHYSPRDLRLGLVEASANKIGSPVDQLLLFCFHYDPTTGQYTPAIMNFVRLAGAVTLVALIGFMFKMWRSERRKVREPTCYCLEDAPEVIALPTETQSASAKQCGATRGDGTA